MHLIAVDEAGYGPKLGPLVIAATQWRCRSGQPSHACVPCDELPRATEQLDLWAERLETEFDALKQPVDVNDLTIRVDDSKRVFQSRSSKPSHQGYYGPLETLHRIVSVAHYLAGRKEPRLSDRLASLIPKDYQAVIETPWLAALPDASTVPDGLPNRFASRRHTSVARQQWGHSPWQLKDVRARMITASNFNAFCGDQGDSSAVGALSKAGNKSDLLSESSLGLVADIIGEIRSNRQIVAHVFCDRHGGRRYYAGVIQQAFPGSMVEVIEETSRRSVYHMQFGKLVARLHFTVKGDRFAPVALSSLHAKYLREVAMGAFNHFFQNQLAKLSSRQNTEMVFKPTAGYPVDAGRFLNLIRPVLDWLKIEEEAIVRCR